MEKFDRLVEWEKPLVCPGGERPACPRMSPVRIEDCICPDFDENFNIKGKAV